MSDVALDSLIDLLNSNGINCSPAQIDLLHELADYQVMRGTDIFDGPEIISLLPTSTLLNNLKIKLIHLNFLNNYFEVVLPP